MHEVLVTCSILPPSLVEKIASYDAVDEGAGLEDAIGRSSDRLFVTPGY